MVEDVKYTSWQDMVPKLEPKVVETIKDKLKHEKVTKT